MRFRFTIRELMLFVAVVAICAAWLVDHAHMAERQRKAKFIISYFELIKYVPEDVWGENGDIDGMYNFIARMRDELEDAVPPVANGH